VEVLAEFRRITIPLVCTGGCHSFRTLSVIDTQSN